MTSADEIKKRLDEVKELDSSLDRRIEVLAILTDVLSKEGITPVLVGGAAVEFYTLGGYATKDMDVIMPSSASVSSSMIALGFRKEGRFWISDDLDVVLEAPSGPLAGDPERILRSKVNDMSAYIIGVEDLIIDRLNAFVHWQSTNDRRWAARLMAMLRDSIDWDYLEWRAREDRVDAALMQIRSEIPEAGDERN